MGVRNFDPVVVGNHECDAWVAYYRRDWGRFLRGAVGMVRTGFAMPWSQTLHGAWLVLRANQMWAPYPENDPDAAREFMRRFYALVRSYHDLSIDPAEAARREVEWWRVHRVHQRENQLTEDDLTEALVDLYSYVYTASRESVRTAAHQRVLAMGFSDEWVRGGCAPGDERLADERLALVASYTALRAAVEKI